MAPRSLRRADYLYIGARKTERHPVRKTNYGPFFCGPNHLQITPARSEAGGRNPSGSQRAHTTCLPLPEPSSGKALGFSQVEGKEPMHLSCPSKRNKKKAAFWQASFTLVTFQPLPVDFGFPRSAFSKVPGE